MREELNTLEEMIMDDEEYRRVMMEYLMMVAQPNGDPVKIQELQDRLDAYEKLNMEDDSDTQ